METTNKIEATRTTRREVVIRINVLLTDITLKARKINETTEMIDVEDKGMIIMSTIRVKCELTIMSICMVAEDPMKSTIAITTTDLITIAKRNWTTSMITIGIMMMSMTRKRIDKNIQPTKMIPTNHLIIGKFATKILVREIQISKETLPGTVVTSRGKSKTSAEIVKRFMRGSSLMKNEIIGTTTRIKSIPINAKSTTGMKRASFRKQKEKHIRRKIKVRHHRKRRKSVRIRPFSTNFIPMMNPQKPRTKSSTISARMNSNGRTRSMKRIRRISTTIQLLRAVAHLVEVVQT